MSWASARWELEFEGEVRYLCLLDLPFGRVSKASCFKPPCAIMAIAAQQDQLGPGLMSRAPSLISTLPLPFGKGGLKNLEVTEQHVPPCS
ncbi:unnamed protein product [Prunus armeniaca]